MQLHLETWGDAAAPRTAVLLHGITSSAAGWERVARALAARGFHVIAADLRGHGSSPKTPGAYDLRSMAEDVAECIPRNPDLLLGHSLGGAIALLATAEGLVHPGRLVLEDPAMVMPSKDAAESYIAGSELGPSTVEGILAAYPRWALEDAVAKSEALRTIAWDDMREILVGNAPWDLRHQCASTAGVVPTLLILAGPSTIVPPDLQSEIERIFGSGSVVAVEGAGHSVHRDDLNGFLGALLSWLDAQDAVGGASSRVGSDAADAAPGARAG